MLCGQGWQQVQHVLPGWVQSFPISQNTLLLPSGWYLGERLRDGEKGWFPQSCAQQITDRSAVERNVRRLERLRIETDV